MCQQKIGNVRRCQKELIVQYRDFYLKMEQ